MTSHTTMVASWNKFRSIQNLSLRPKRRLCFDLIAFLSTFWFLLCGGMYTNLSFEVEHIIGTKSSTKTWLQQIFSLFLEIDSAIKHLACILRDSFSHLRSSTSLLNKTSLASKFIFKHSNSFSFSREFSTRFLYFSTNLLDSLSLAIKSSFSQNNLFKFFWNFLIFYLKSLMLGISTTPKIHLAPLMHYSPCSYLQLLPYFLLDPFVYSCQKGGEYTLE